MGSAYGSALLVAYCAAVVKYCDPSGDRDQHGFQNPAHGVLIIFGNCARGLWAPGITSDLATCRPVQDVLQAKAS